MFRCVKTIADGSCPCVDHPVTLHQQLSLAKVLTQVMACCEQQVELLVQGEVDVVRLYQLLRHRLLAPLINLVFYGRVISALAKDSTLIGEMEEVEEHGNAVAGHFPVVNVQSLFVAVHIPRCEVAVRYR